MLKYLYPLLCILNQRLWESDSFIPIEHTSRIILPKVTEQAKLFKAANLQVSYWWYQIHADFLDAELAFRSYRLPSAGSQILLMRTYNLLICAQNYSYALKHLLSRSEY